jgi:hypothetical protein
MYAEGVNRGAVHKQVVLRTNALNPHTPVTTQVDTVRHLAPIQDHQHLTCQTMNGTGGGPGPNPWPTTPLSLSRRPLLSSLMSQRTEMTVCRIELLEVPPDSLTWFCVLLFEVNAGSGSLILLLFALLQDSAAV